MPRPGLAPLLLLLLTFPALASITSVLMLVPVRPQLAGVQGGQDDVCGQRAR